MSDTGPSVAAPDLPETKEAQTPSDHIAVGPPRTPDAVPTPRDTKRSVSKPLIAAIVLLLLSLPVIIYFVSMRSQSIADIRNRATGSNYTCGGTSAPSIGCDGGTWFCNNGNWGCNMGGTIGGTCPNPYLTGGGDPCRINGVSVPCSQVHMIRCYCGGPPKDQPGAVWVAGSDTATCDSLCRGVGVTCTPCNPPDTTTPPPGPTNTPHPTTPTTNPVCQNIKIYKGGTQVTDLTALKAGDEVVLAVKGNLSPTKAHFRVNGKKPSNANQTGWDETTDKNSSDEFTLSYTIPEGVSDFVVEGEVFTNGAWH